MAIILPYSIGRLVSVIPGTIYQMHQAEDHCELYEIFNEPNIVNYEYIKVNRQAWAGHLVRMNNDRTLKKIFNTKPDGARSAGRPKLRWEDGVDQDMRILGVKNWKKVALNRDECSKYLKKVRAHQGLSSQ